MFITKKDQQFLDEIVPLNTGNTGGHLVTPNGTDSAKKVLECTKELVVIITKRDSTLSYVFEEWNLEARNKTVKVGASHLANWSKPFELYWLYRELNKPLFGRTTTPYSISWGLLGWVALYPGVALLCVLQVLATEKFTENVAKEEAHYFNTYQNAFKECMQLSSQNNRSEKDCNNYASELTYHLR